MSSTYIATIISFLTLALPHLGIQIVDPNTFAGVVTGTIGVLSTLYIFYGRFKAGGITALGLRTGSTSSAQ